MQLRRADGTEGYPFPVDYVVAVDDDPPPWSGTLCGCGLPVQGFRCVGCGAEHLAWVMEQEAGEATDWSQWYERPEMLLALTLEFGGKWDLVPYRIHGNKLRYRASNERGVELTLERRYRGRWEYQCPDATLWYEREMQALDHADELEQEAALARGLA